MQIQAIDLRVGYIVLIDGKYCNILEINPIERGRGKSYVQIIYKVLSTGNKNNVRLATDEGIEKINSTEVKAIFLYLLEDEIALMIPDTLEQISLNVSKLNGNKNFLQEEMELSVTFAEETGEYISIDFPHHASFVVRSIENNCAVIGDGIKIKVPNFIKPDDVINVNIEEEKYLNKA